MAESDFVPDIPGDSGITPGVAVPDIRPIYEPGYQPGAYPQLPDSYAPVIDEGPGAGAPVEIPDYPEPLPPIVSGYAPGPGDYLAYAPTYYPGSGRLSERELRRRLGEPMPGGLPSILGVGAIFGRRRFVPSRLERNIARMARMAGRAVVRGAISAVRSLGRIERVPTITNLPTVIRGPVIDIIRQPVGWKLGGAIGAILGAAVPTPLGSGELPIGPPPALAPGASWPSTIRRRATERGLQRQRRREELERFTDPFRQPGGQPITPIPRGPRPVPEAIAPQGPTSFGERVLESLGIPRTMEEVYEELGKQLGLPPMTTGQDRTPPSSPAPRPVPQQVRVGAPTAPAPRARQPRIGLGIGAIAAGLVLESIQRGGGSPAPAASALVPVSAPSSPTPTPIAPPLLAPLTLVGSAGLGFGGAGETCNCRPRGPRRKCLQRAPVRWAGGPRKGRSAGTRCIRFAR